MATDAAKDAILYLQQIAWDSANQMISKCYVRGIRLNAYMLTSKSASYHGNTLEWYDTSEVVSTRNLWVFAYTRQLLSTCVFTCDTRKHKISWISNKYANASWTDSLPSRWISYNIQVDMRNDICDVVSHESAFNWHRNISAYYSSAMFVLLALNLYLHSGCFYDIFSCDHAALWLIQSVCPSVCLSVCPSHLFDYVPIIVSSWNFQELSPRTRVRSMQMVKVRGQSSSSQRSQPNFTVSGL